MSRFGWETQNALDNYDKEGHALAQMDREDKVMAAVEQVLAEYASSKARTVSLDTMAKLARVAIKVREERRKMEGRT